ncbi:MAG: hypothetical protein A2017_11790 [Lentisphaerae bacterium GWF2_44_16]|nr:MAG: hypothetical protein A2017_11790 [Lentisphaerae bacterium GWF2_44_16]
MNSFLNSTVLLVAGLAIGVDAAPLTLENQFWKIQMEPDLGGRCSSLLIKENNEELVKGWDAVKKQGKRKTTKQQYSGGIWGGHMCGAYQDEQLEAVYELGKNSPSEVSMRWNNPYTLFSGLEETRQITLDGASIYVKIQVENLSKERRVIYYRIQDFIGTGGRLGPEAVYLYPQRDGLKAEMLKAGRTFPLMQVPGSWYGITDMVKDYGIKVQTSGAPLRNVMFWVGSAKSRTCELFWAPATLEPGQKWNAEITYSLFKPSQRQDELSAASINTALAQNAERLVFPQLMDPVFAPANGKAIITPLHGAASAPTTPIIEQFKTLKAVKLFGTPGETVPAAFSITAREALTNGTVTFSDFKNSSGKALKMTADPYYISRDGNDYMLKDWDLAVNVPQEICNIKSHVKGSEKLTAFNLEKDASAHLRAYLRIAPEAEAGDYSGYCTIRLNNSDELKLKIDLKVYPFKLEMPKDKGYGAFFRFGLEGDSHDAGQNFGISREAYRKALEELTARNWRNLVLYLGNKENILYALDTLVELGWRDARFVLVRPVISHAELMERYGKYNFSFLPWGVDEPIDYFSVDKAIKKYQQISQLDYPSMNFSANTPLSLALMDILPKTEPTIAVTGNVMYFVDKSRELHKQGRRSFWYAGYPNREVQGRLLRGIYVWKEPACGMMDWGEDSCSKQLGTDFHGFLDGKLVSTQRLENITQGVNDLLYLNTMEQALAKADPKSEASKNAAAFIAWIKKSFDTDYTGEAREIDQYFLDMLRRKAADLTVELNKMRMN